MAADATSPLKSRDERCNCCYEASKRPDAGKPKLGSPTARRLIV
jgi:hypothetical protein